MVSSTTPDESMPEKDPRIVPNPSGGIFDIVFDEVKPDVQIQLFNSTGQLIHKGQFHQYKRYPCNFSKPSGPLFYLCVHSW
jgi:hypothetical protein